MKIHFENYPSFKAGDEATLEMQLWEKLAEAGVLVAPGWYFSAYVGEAPDAGEGHFRISFSNAEVRPPLISKYIILTSDTNSSQR